MEDLRKDEMEKNIKEFKTAVEEKSIKMGEELPLIKDNIKNDNIVEMPPLFIEHQVNRPVVREVLKTFFILSQKNLVESWKNAVEETKKRWDDLSAVPEDNIEEFERVATIYQFQDIGTRKEAIEVAKENYEITQNKFKEIEDRYNKLIESKTIPFQEKILDLMDIVAENRSFEFNILDKIYKSSSIEIQRMMRERDREGSKVLTDINNHFLKTNPDIELAENIDLHIENLRNLVITLKKEFNTLTETGKPEKMDIVDWNMLVAKKEKAIKDHENTLFNLDTIKVAAKDDPENKTLLDYANNIDKQEFSSVFTVLLHQMVQTRMTATLMHNEKFDTYLSKYNKANVEEVGRTIKTVLGVFITTNYGKIVGKILKTMVAKDQKNFLTFAGAAFSIPEIKLELLRHLNPLIKEEEILYALSKKAEKTQPDVDKIVSALKNTKTEDILKTNGVIHAEENKETEEVSVVTP